MVNLLDAVAGSPEEAAIVACALFAGLRRGEVFGLRWSDIAASDDGPGGRLHIRWNIYKSIVQTPKTEKSLRVVGGRNE